MKVEQHTDPELLAEAAGRIFWAAIGREATGTDLGRWRTVAAFALAVNPGDRPDCPVRDVADGFSRLYHRDGRRALYEGDIGDDERVGWEAVARFLAWEISGQRTTKLADFVEEAIEYAAGRGAASRGGE